MTDIDAMIEPLASFPVDRAQLDEQHATFREPTTFPMVVKFLDHYSIQLMVSHLVAAPPHYATAPNLSDKTQLAK